MNLVVPQQVKDRFSEAQAQVRGQLVALTQRANTNYAEARQRLDALLPADLGQFWNGLRDKLQLLLDIAPRTELLALQTKLDELSSELAIVATERASLKDELVKLLDDKLALLPAPVAAAPVIEVVEEAELAAVEAAPVEAPAPAAKPEPKASNGKAKNGNQRRR